MSAITIIFSRDGAAVDQNALKAMVGTRPERGPDGFDLFVNQWIGLAHQHFWLLPEETGELQPLVSGELALTADVRLDNREQLARLLGLGTIEAASTTDAGFLLLSYLKWEEKCLEYLVGDFAFALWDGRRHRLFVARDALGSMDLCYYESDKCFIAASEISQLLAHPSVPCELNERRVASYLCNLWNSPEETFYEGISYFPPGHAMIVGRHESRVWSHWNPETVQEIRYKDEQDYVTHYLSLLKDAVRCRLRSSGPIGLSLSGGLDSTALAALAAPVLQMRDQHRLRTYSYAFEELSSCDERRFIEPLVEELDLHATYILCDDRWTLKDLPDWPSTRDIVLSDAFAWLPNAAMNAAERDGVRLLLAGYFGDVLSAGGHFWALDMLREGQLLRLLRTAASHSSTSLWRRSVFNFGIRQLMPGPVTRAYRRLRPRVPEAAAPGIHPSLVKQTDVRYRLVASSGREKFSTPGLGHRYEALTSAAFSQGIAATRHQYNQHGMEIAEPYHDRRLVEFALAVPAYVLGRPGCNRLLQRRAMQDYLPEAVWRRSDKTTFAPLMLKGLRDKEAHTLHAILQDPQIVKREFVTKSWLRAQLNEPFRLSEASAFLWLCASLELWLKRYWN